MRWQRMTWVMVMAGVMGTGVAFGVFPPAAPGGGASSVSEPAPKAAVRAFFRAVRASDHHAAKDYLVFANPTQAQTVQVMIDHAISEEALSRVIERTFSQEAPAVVKSLESATVASEKDLEKATVSMEGEKAEVVTETGPRYFLVRKDGAWKIDFDKTQGQMGALPAAGVVEAIKQETAAMDKLAGAIHGKQLTNFNDVRVQLMLMEEAMRQAMSAEAARGAMPATDAHR